MILSGTYWKIFVVICHESLAMRMNHELIHGLSGAWKMSGCRSTGKVFKFLWKSHIAAGRVILVEKPLPRAISREIWACSIAFSWESPLKPELLKSQR